MNNSNRQRIIYSLGLIIFTVAAYFPMLAHDFVSIDDNLYVTTNKWVQQGLSFSSIKWAFTTTLGEFYHPLTWISLMLDTTLFGYSPTSFHFTNLLLHCLNTLLLFTILGRMTKQFAAAATVALLFAIHPLHVESVAWVAERKDLLSGVFFFLAVYWHIRFVQQPSWIHKLLIILFFLLGLLSKTIVITLPFILLLLDYWPLHRISFLAKSPQKIRLITQLISEKIPLFLLTVIFALSTYWIQSHMGGVVTFEQSSLGERLANVLVSYGWYILKIFNFENLAFFYPYNAALPLLEIVVASCFLFATTTAILVLIKHAPYCAVGWFWYLGTLFPVCGIIRIGDFARADRYTYLPLIGAFILIIWPISLFLEKRPYKHLTLPALFVCIGLTLFPITIRQVSYWRNSAVLYVHALQVTENNHLAHFGLAHLLASRGDLTSALYHFEQAVQILPTKAPLHQDLARALAAKGYYEKALDHLDTALIIKPKSKAAHYYSGLILIILDQPQKAMPHILSAFSPEDTESKIINTEDDYLKIELLVAQGLKLEEKIEKRESAIGLYQKALRIRPDFYPAISALANHYIQSQEYYEALALFNINSDKKQLRQLIIQGYNDNLSKNR
ncbi:MAG: tetratricopeptide repeat protein [Desulfobulbaceae bacterium]|nr:tetratricopeptide repeat protein [Desulfobulbaceae bacterium]